MISKEDVLKALSTVIDPDLGKDVVTLNMIKNVKTKETSVSFIVEVSTPSGKTKETIRKGCKAAIHKAFGDDTRISIILMPKITSNRKDKQNLLPGVKNIIAVASGKGGVGKSTVAANLALALAQEGAEVGLMDADIYGPSVPIMFGLKGEKPKIVNINGKGKMAPIERYGIKLVSIGFLVDEKQAVVWRGPMVSKAIMQFVNDTHWGELDYLIIDLPPGTGDIHLTMVQTIPVTGVVIVTTPQQVALADARKGVAMFSTGGIDVPILGIVENMSYFTPAELPDNKYYIFGRNGGKKLCEDYDIPLLGQIPLVESICEGGDLGVPVLMADEEVTKNAFLDFARETARQVTIRNANLDPTKVIQIDHF